MKNYYHLFVYISLVFLITSLYYADYLIIPEVFSLDKIYISFLFLFAGFIMDALSWHKTITYLDSRISFRDAITSIGLSIFGKYIPGKFWVIAGRSAFLAKKYNLDEKDTTAISINAVFISLWTALLIGGVGILLIEGISQWGYIALFLWTILSIILFAKWPHELLHKLLIKICKKDILIPHLNVKDVFRVVHWFFMTWILWSLSFYFFVDGLSENPIGLLVGFVFTIGTILGILVIFAPGGIGVREGVLFAFLILCGLEAPVATSIAIASRLWFLCGEFFIFFLGYLLKTRN